MLNSPSTQFTGSYVRNSNYPPYLGADLVCGFGKKSTIRVTKFKNLNGIPEKRAEHNGGRRNGKKTRTQQNRTEIGVLVRAASLPDHFFPAAVSFVSIKSSARPETSVTLLHIAPQRLPNFSHANKNASNFQITFSHFFQ